MQLNESSVIRINDVTELYAHSIFSFKPQQRKEGWLAPKVS